MTDERIVYVDGATLAPSEVMLVAHQRALVEVSGDAWPLIHAARDVVERIVDQGETVYGINTGFGALCDVRIHSENLTKLQENLVRSHACGTGELVPKPIIKLMLLLKIKSLSYGHSGIQLETMKRLIDFYNNDITCYIHPRIFGSFR